MGVTDASDSRLGVLTRWVTEDLGFAGSRIEPASADASFRRYFRVTRGSDTYIVMDAPPDKETLEPFVGVARSLLGHGAERTRGSGARRAAGPAAAVGSRHAPVPGPARRGPRRRSPLRGRARRAGEDADPRRGGGARLASLRPRPATSRDGADAGVVSGTPSRGTREPGRARNARPVVRYAVAKRARSNRRRSCIAIIIRAISW